MELKTRAIVVVQTEVVPVPAVEEAINTITVVRSCANCYHAQWNDEKTSVYCDKALSQPPLWAVAMGCNNFDYLPF